jgi:hypothetical protein
MRMFIGAAAVVALLGAGAAQAASTAPSPMLKAAPADQVTKGGMDVSARRKANKATAKKRRAARRRPAATTSDKEADPRGTTPRGPNTPATR